MGKIIVIEDNPVYCDYICNRIEKNGFRTEKVSSLSGARRLVASAKEDDIILADLRLPDGDSIELLKWMREKGMRQPFIIMTDYAEVHTAVETMKSGAEDYIPKKLLEDKLFPAIRKLQKRLERISAGKEMLYERDSEAFLHIWQQVRIVAPTDMTVLILGENGTGKEHIAEKLHLQSTRADKPFIPVDCGSLSPALSPSAFFGHVKGAFTGADKDKEGYFREAEGGTLFLDEIGNLSMETQQMLLRSIQERKYRPVGASREYLANVRIISATNEDLQKTVAEKRFRQDLFYRLRDFIIHVPSLQESPEDILPLASFFVEQGNKEFSKGITGFDASARKALLSYIWPGNVRELKQVIRSAVLLTESSMITSSTLEPLMQQLATDTVPLALKDEETEKEHIRQALEQAGGNRKIAAKLLKVSRSTLYRKMEQYKML